MGKTKIIIEAFKSILSPSHVITVPYNTIADTWQEESLKWDLNKKLNVINQRSINKIEESPDLLVIDEIHSLSDNQIDAIKELNPKRIIGLSGTLSKESKSRLRKELGLKVIYEYSIENAVRDNIVSNYEINVVYLPLDKKDKYIKAGSKKRQFSTTEYAHYEYLTKQFNRFKFLAYNDKKLEAMKYKWAGNRSRFLYSAKSKIELAQKIINSFKERMLIFTTLTDVADQLSDYSHHSKSENDNLSRFINNEIRTLSVCNMVDMGKLMPL